MSKLSRPGTKKSSSTNSEALVRQLSELIRRGKIRLLPNGRLPPERELANIFGVSLLNMRNRMRSLAVAGILRSERGVGTFLVEPSHAVSLGGASFCLLAAIYGFTRDEIFETRLALEADIAALAAERATNEDLILLVEEIIGMFASSDHPQQFFLHDQKFHQIIAAASKNRILSALLDSVTDIFFEENRRSPSRSVDLNSLANLYLQIYQAIRNRNPEAAKHKIYEYLIKAK